MSSGFFRYRNLGPRVTYVNASIARLNTARGRSRTHDLGEAAGDPPHRTRYLEAASRPVRRNLAPATVAGHDRQVRTDQFAQGAARRRTLGGSESPVEREWPLEHAHVRPGG